MLHLYELKMYINLVSDTLKIEIQIEDESEHKRCIINLSANSTSQKKKNIKEIQVHRKKHSLHEHKINIPTEFTNTVKHKIYCLDKGYSSTGLKRSDLKGTYENTSMFRF